MSIASELTTLANNKAAIKAAIAALNPATPLTDDLSQWPASISSVPSQALADPSKPVRFFDCNGDVLHSFTSDEALALAELPPLPSHEQLTCQGWNYTL